ncbi:hypothetical protein AGMMS49950_00520 [Endomicrobiia bacterium]|nr:hypothetical protein AGMMS49950_00520 [Endomicrobiia bacterium]
MISVIYTKGQNNQASIIVGISDNNDKTNANKTSRSLNKWIGFETCQEYYDMRRPNQKLVVIS